MSVKKIIFGIFAHPDDEAFGPSGTLLLETRAGSELHLITLTAGENGTNPDSHQDLGAIRLVEWRAAGQLIGASSMHHFGYIDGTLGNIDHVAITTRLESLVRDVLSRQAEPVEIEFMSIDLNGITGHIDHIVAARSACLAFYRLKTAGLPLSRIRLACLAQTQLATANTDFTYMEAGHPLEEIDETIDARAVIDDIYAIMRTHHTQRQDGEVHIARHGEGVAINHFIVRS
jgi:LmbE family N-acetylglucosaminyl deacetylase